MCKQDDYALGYAAYLTGVGFNAHQSHQWQDGWKDAQADEAEDNWDYILARDGGYGDGGF